MLESPFLGRCGGFSEYEKDQVLSERLKAKFVGRTSAAALAPIRERFLQHAIEHTAINWMTYLELNLRIPELLMARVDKMTMATSVEARVPYLDHEFIELAFAIPSSIRANGRDAKRILKMAFRQILPPEIINRKKQGFGIPIDELLKRELGDEVEARLCGLQNLLIY